MSDAPVCRFDIYRIKIRRSGMEVRAGKKPLRQLDLKGKIQGIAVGDNSVLGGDALLHISTAPDQEWYDRVAVETGVGEHLGAFGTDPKLFELEGASAQGRLFVDDQTIDLIYQHAHHSSNNAHDAYLTLVIAGGALPPPPSRVVNVPLTALDRTKDALYAVTGLEIRADLGNPSRFRNQIELMKPAAPVGNGSDLRVKLDQVSFSLAGQETDVSRVYASGVSIKQIHSDFEPTEVTVNFVNFPEDEDYALPEKAFAGTYRYDPLGTYNPDSPPHIEVDLHCTADECNAIMAKCMDNQKASVILKLYFDRKLTDISKSTSDDQVTGNIYGYGFDVSKAVG